LRGVEVVENLELLETPVPEGKKKITNLIGGCVQKKKSDKPEVGIDAYFRKS